MSATKNPGATLVADDEFVPNATYKEKPKRSSLKIEKLITWWRGTATYSADGQVLKPARTIMLQAHAGVGKTSFIKDVLARLGIGMAYFSGSSLLPPDWVLTFPRLVKMLEDGSTVDEIMADRDGGAELSEMVSQMRYELVTRLAPRLQFTKPSAIVIDEASRIETVMLSTFMELFQSHRVAGLDIPNLLGVIGIRNPVGAGYVGTTAGDHAFETRFPVFELTAKDIPWQEALARKYADIDLSGVFDVWKTLDATARDTLCPRVVEGAIKTIPGGLPTLACLPLRLGKRVQILTQTGEDITESTMRKLAAALGQPYRESAEDLIRSAVKTICIDGAGNLALSGGAGMGKSAYIEALGKELGIEMRIESAANLNPQDLIMLLPSSIKGEVESQVTNKLTAAPGHRYILVLDELHRAPKSTLNQLLEVVQERSIGGEPLPGCHAVIAIDNPARQGAIQYKVGNADDAMISRFQASLELTTDDIDWRSYLETVFGDEVVKPFAEWWSQDLNADERDFIPPRVLEIMMELHVGGMDIDDALPFVGNERVPIRTHTLKARLHNRKVLGLSAILAEKENLLAILGDEASDEAEKTDVSSAVVRALQKADLKELEPHVDDLVRFIKVLPPHSRTAILNAAKAKDNDKARKKMEFWSQVYVKTL